MDTTKVIADLRAQRERLNQAIAALEALDGITVSHPTTKMAKKAAAPAPGAKQTAKKRVISPEGRKHMAEAQQKRWAKKEKATKVAAKTA